jgi:hypothetical protein
MISNLNTNVPYQNDYRAIGGINLFEIESKFYPKGTASVSNLEEDTSYYEVSKNIILIRLFEMIDRLIKENDIFQTVDGIKLKSFLSKIINRVPVGKIAYISENELKERTKRLLAIEVFYEFMDDFSPSEKEIFKESMKRGDFFV